MHTLLERIADTPGDNDIGLLIELVDALRPAKPDQIAEASANVRTLVKLLNEHPALAAGLRLYLLRVLSTRRQTSLYTDIGVLPSDGFFTELFRRLSYRLLPPAIDDFHLRDCLDYILPNETDYLWIGGVPADEWLALFDVLAAADSTPGAAAASDDVVGNLKELDAPARRVMMQELLEAVQTLSYRISAMGLEPSLIRIHPDIEAFESPFLTQNAEVHRYLESMIRFLDGAPAPAEDSAHLLVLLDQCDTVIAKIRRNALHKGTSVALTYLLVRLTQNIERLRKLVSLIDVSREDGKPIDPAARRNAAMALGLELVEAHNRKYAVRELFRNNIDLLARNVTENASRTGEHYIAEDRSQQRAMFRTSAGAGIIVGFMGLFKILASYLRAAPLVEAFLFSLNYSLGFMLIHILHFTVATKQPAMTASRIASGLQSRDGRNIDLDSLVELIVKVIRTQSAAVMGNLATAFPVAYLIAWGYFLLFGQHLVSEEKAHHLLHDLDPFGSLSLWYAAIAGVCLFMAGLITGYYDNKAVYSRIAQRIARVNWLDKRLGNERLGRFAQYIEANLGGLMGNFFFGVLLGGAGLLGLLLGLPIDIRHITLSTTYLATALVGLEHDLSWQLIVTSVVGIFAIGTVNLLVSFGLALMVALRSRQVRFTHRWMLIKALLLRFVTRPKDFFLANKYPPEAVADVAAEPSKKTD